MGGNRIPDFHGPDSRRCHNLELAGREVRTASAFTEVERRIIYSYLCLYISRNLSTAKINMRVRRIIRNLVPEIQMYDSLIHIYTRHVFEYRPLFDLSRKYRILLSFRLEDEDKNNYVDSRLSGSRRCYRGLFDAS